MNKIFFPCMAILIVAACNTNTTDKKQETIAVIKDTVVKINIPSITGCYMMVISKDTAFMHLDDSSGFLSGHLSYKRYEKDSNRGTVTLTQKDDKLKGWYSFTSEGKLSVREIIFKTTDSTLAEGYGDVEMVGDSVFFKYPGTLKFEEAHPFIKRDCK